MAKTEKYLEGLTIHKVPYNIANTSDFKTNVMGKAADNELFIITDTPTFSLKIGNVTYDGTSNVSANTATESVSGLMSAADKAKLNGIAEGATKIKVDTALSNTSTNPVQNKVIYSALSGKAGTSVATTNTNGLMSAADKTKLNGIAKEANKTIVDTTLSDSSTNPVQNKVVKAALDNKADKTALDAKADKTALDGKLDKTGGTLTGNLTGKDLTGTWLQTTAATDLGRTPGKVAVLDDSGWVYYRTPAEIKSDIGVDTQTIIDTIYPVGSIYITLNQTSPSKLFPGTYWKQIKNRFLLSASSTYSALSFGGEATHALTTSEMAKHRHDGLYYSYIDTKNLVTLDNGTVSYRVPWGSSSYAGNYGAGTGKKELITGEVGGGAAHNNMPPYLAVYMWERINRNQASDHYDEDVYFIYGVK